MDLEEIEHLLDSIAPDKNREAAPRHHSEDTPLDELLAELDGVVRQLSVTPPNLGSDRRSCATAALTYSRTYKACVKMRCLSCDHKIIPIDGGRWSKDADYLFYRNNYPVEEKLRSAIVPAVGYIAYCCQCRGLSVNSQQGVPISTATSDASFIRNWKCTGH
ncbi:hypothetical protein FOL47_009616 [Perkinsus chesapeaki]|uniref:Cilia- and flagella-associated protein 418 n=1 Tax=Perkinsus chesapeaki TaxID=330153 RepID=A0A7J6L791_PERCH|nr:hypothetical protein FOL47_009616 [Perkinsus chesapeaki]